MPSPPNNLQLQNFNQFCTNSWQFVFRALTNYGRQNQISPHTVILVTKMLFSLLQWNKPLDNENLGSSENRNPNVQKERKPGISSTIMEQLNKSVDLTQGRLKHRDAAILVMRLLLKSDSRLSEYCPQFDVTEYLAFLDVIEQVDFSTASFGGKHVLGIEGLQFSGKSTLIDQITSRYANIEVIKRRKVPEIITNHSLTAQIAWDCLENYRIAKLIIDSSSDVILIEDYYHNFLAKYISVKVASENDLVNLPYTTFSWPHDLPMPELVSFSCILYVLLDLCLRSTNQIRRFFSSLHRPHSD